jgi:hypothetical protein
MIDDMGFDLKLPTVGEMTFPQWQEWLVHYNALLLKRGRRIEKLEAAMREILSFGEWGANPLARTVILEALESKCEQLEEGA